MPTTPVLNTPRRLSSENSRTPSAVPAVKLVPPLPPATYVKRAGLLSRACTPMPGGVTLLKAPCGFGKTTLLQACRQQLAQTGTATVWVNLDASDNDGQRLLHCLNEACAQAWAPNAAVDGHVRATRLSTAGCAGALFDRLEHIQAPFAIFLDDFEELQDTVALGWIAELIQRLPAHGRLMLAARRQPELPLSRLRARGRLAELDTAALRFTLPETEELLNSLRCLGLSGSEISRLHERTEGWVAGLSLAALALERIERRSDFVERFSGCHATVSEYLSECVLAHQREPVRQFLLRTSVLKQFDADLCTALLPDVDTHAMLAELRAADVLLMPIDGDGRWFRYHSMFASFLQSVLEREAPGELAELHRRAARWYAALQRPVPAITHALHGGDVPLAIRLLRAHALPLMAQGRTRLLDRWLSTLPAAAMQDEPWLQAMHAWAATYTRGAESASALLDRYRLDRCDDQLVQDCLRPLKPVLLALMDRAEESAAVGLECIAQLSARRGFADAMLLCSVACVLVNLGDEERGRALLDQARRVEGAMDSNFMVVQCETAEALIDVRGGRLRQALARLRHAVDTSRRGASSHFCGNAWTGVLHACVLYESGELEVAEQLLRAQVPAVQAVGLADLMILVYRNLARIAFRRGDVEDAFQAVSALQSLGLDRRLDRVVASAKLERSRLLLAQGHAEAAREELERAEDQTLWLRVGATRMAGNEVEDCEIGRWRWNIHAGDAAAAAAELAGEVTTAVAQRRIARAFKLRLLHALALERTGRHEAALGVTGDLLRDTCVDRFVQLFVDEGSLALGLLKAYSRAASMRCAARETPAFKSYVEHLIQAFGQIQTDSPQESAAVLREPLTRRERTILELVAHGMGDSALAEKLFLSLSTVRTHLRNIYVKLDVHNRMQAVVAARRAGVM